MIQLNSVHQQGEKMSMQFLFRRYHFSPLYCIIPFLLFLVSFFFLFVVPLSSFISSPPLIRSPVARHNMCDDLICSCALYGQVVNCLALDDFLFHWSVLQSKVVPTPQSTDMFQYLSLASCWFLTLTHCSSWDERMFGLKTVWSWNFFIHSLWPSLTSLDAPATGTSYAVVSHVLIPAFGGKFKSCCSFIFPIQSQFPASWAVFLRWLMIARHQFEAARSAIVTLYYTF